jgi:phosphopantetheine adenylyltransferase
MNVIALPTPDDEDPHQRIRALEQEKRDLADRLERKEREAEVQRGRADSYAMQLSTERERIKSVIVDLENSEVALRVERRRRSQAEEKLKRMAE